MELITKTEIINDLQKIGVKKGDLLNVKVSLKSIGKVEGGAKTVIDALLEVVGEEGTIVSEAFIDSVFFPLIYLKYFIYNKNKPLVSYAGAITNTMLSYKNSVTCTHPIHRFVAIGKLAEPLMATHTPDTYAYEVVRRMPEMGGKNLRIGDKVVGNGTTHVAIGLSGLRQKNLKSGIVYLRDGKKKIFVSNWAGGCRYGFNALLDKYEPNGGVIGKGKIGNAASMLTDMRKTLDYELKEINSDPNFFLCKDSGCVNCRLSWEFSSGKTFEVFKYNLKRRKYKYAIKAILLKVFGKYYP